MKNQCLKTLCTTIFVALLITPVIADSVDPNSPDIVSIGKFGRQHIVVKPGEDFKVPVFIKCDEDIGSFTISIAVEKESIRKLIKVELTDEFAKRLEIEWGKSKQSVQGDEYNSYTLFCVSKNDRPFNTHRVWKQIASFIFEPVEDTSAVCTVSLIKSGDENGAVFRIANQKEFNPIFKIFHYSPDTVIIGQLDRQHIIVKRGEDFEIPVYVKCDEDLESFAISIAVEKEPIRKLKKVELTDRYANYLEIEWKQNKDSFQGDDYNSYTIICKSKNDRIFNTGGHSWKQIASFIFEPVRDTSVICTVSRILPGDENGAVFRTADHKEFNPVFKTLHFNIVPDDYEIQDLKKYRRRRPAERFVVGFNKGITAEEPVEKAYQYFEFRKDTLGLEYPRKEMLVNKVIEDSDETRVVFRQYVDDVGVCGTKYTFTFDESGTIIDVRGKVIPDAAGAAEPGKAISKEKALDTVIPIIEDNGLEIVDEKASYLAVIKIHEKYYKAWVFYLVTDTKPKSIPSLWVVRAVNGKLLVAEKRFIDTDQYDLVDMTPIDKIYDYAKTHKETGFIYPEHELIQRGFKKHTYCTGGVTELFDVAFEGVRIHKAKVRVKLNMDGDVIQFKGSMDPQIRLIDTEPSISADQAEKLIYSKHENYDKKNVELAIIKHQDKYYLTWIVRRLGLIYQVDAHSGDVLEKHSSHHH